MLGAARMGQGPDGAATPVGQAFWVNQGSQSWTVPAGVTSVSIVAIGGGAGNYNVYDEGVGGNVLYYGGGGGLVYVNNMSVTPGETLTVETTASAGSGGSARLSRGATRLINAAGGDRGDGPSSQVQSYPGAEGGFGSVDASVSGAVIRRGGHGYDLGGRTGAAKYDGSSPGLVATSLNGSGDTTGRLCGRQIFGSEASESYSGLRIIYGTGRAFPNTNTGDM